MGNYALRAIRNDVRELALSAVSISAVMETAQREEISRLLWLTGLAGTVLVGTLVVLSLSLYRQSGTSQRNFRDAEAAAQAMGRSRAHFRAAVHASLDAIIIVSDTGEVLEYNAAAESVFGYPRSTAIGAPMADLIIPDSLKEAHSAGMRRHLETGEERVVNQGRVELLARRADGTEFPVEISIGDAVGENGRIFIAFLRDISARKQALSDLNAALNRAESADRAKSEFLAVISHEMRTPLNGVLGALDLMRSTNLSHQQHRYVDVASESAEVLLRHVSDVLDAAMIERGELRLESVPFNLQRLIQSVADISQSAVEARNNRMSMNFADVRGHQVIGDPHRLRQVLLNFVTNAAKFTENGEISIEAQALEETADTLHFELAVTDTGIGIAPEDHAKVFDDFTTINPSYDREIGGVGLGLAICRRIVKGMDGDIGLQSQVGEGSRFHVRLSLAKAGTSTQQVEAQAMDRSTWAPGELRILVADDNDINRIVTGEMLANAGHTCDGASDGFQAVQKAADQQFDLILMDISMPGMDGFQAARQIRSGSGASRDAIIFAVTAHAMQEERERLAEAGMQLCLNKPLRMTALLDALATLRNLDGAAGSAPQTDGHPLHDAVPLIDDEIFVELEDTISPDMFVKTLRRFTAEVHQTMHDIRAAAEANEFDHLGATAHKLIGSAGLVGAARLANQMRSIETAAHAEEPEKVALEILAATPIAEETVAIFDEILDGIPDAAT